MLSEGGVAPEAKHCWANHQNVHREWNGVDRYKLERKMDDTALRSKWRHAALQHSERWGWVWEGAKPPLSDGSTLQAAHYERWMSEALRQSDTKCRAWRSAERMNARADQSSQMIDRRVLDWLKPREALNPAPQDWGLSEAQRKDACDWGASEALDDRRIVDRSARERSSEGARMRR